MGELSLAAAVGSDDEERAAVMGRVKEAAKDDRAGQAGTMGSGADVVARNGLLAGTTSGERSECATQTERLQCPTGQPEVVHGVEPLRLAGWSVVCTAARAEVTATITTLTATSAASGRAPILHLAV